MQRRGKICPRKKQKFAPDATDKVISGKARKRQIAPCVTVKECLISNERPSASFLFVCLEEVWKIDLRSRLKA